MSMVDQAVHPAPAPRSSYIIMHHAPTLKRWTLAISVKVLVMVVWYRQLCRNPGMVEQEEDLGCARARAQL